MTILIGCIGDDFTGSSDIGNVLARQGMRTVLFCGVPEGRAAAGTEAGIVALKSRTIPAEEAVAQSLAALRWLRAQGCRQVVFKYCSTFDSTPLGNIGPVGEALAAALGAAGAIACPAFPALGRTVYLGHLFVGDRLLSESGMRDHPLTPMTDPDLRRWLARQCRHPVGHLPLATIRQGPGAAAAALAAEAARGARLVVADAVAEEDLRILGAAAAGAPLVTGGSGIALGLPANFGIRPGRETPWQGVGGPAVVLSGSCSAATRAQVAAHAGPVRRIDPAAAMDGAVTPGDLADWVAAQSGLPLLASTAAPAEIAAAQARFGREALSARLEGLMAETARALVARGWRRIVVAGGETSGAVVEGLGLDRLEIGPEIDPGVPALRAGPLALALKSGNFGAPDFFARAARVLGGG